MSDSDEVEKMQEALTDWWIEKSRQEIEAVAPKAVEYSAVDLVWVGRTLGLMLGRDSLSDEEATEIGIFFYQVGKMGRWMGAIAEGRRASDDTFLDFGVYNKMVQRNREVGGWPFGPAEEAK